MMEYISKIWEALQSPVGVSVIGTLLIISETLGSSEKFKNSAIITYIKKGLMIIKDKIKPESKS